MGGEYLWPANYGTDHHGGHWQSYSIKGSQISATIFDGIRRSPDGESQNSKVFKLAFGGRAQAVQGVATF
jgi:hypothetical protein